MSGFGGKIKAAMSIDKEKLKSELQELRTRREKVIEERKQFDHELKGLNMQVQKKVGCFLAGKPQQQSEMFIA